MSTNQNDEETNNNNNNNNNHQNSKTNNEDAKSCTSSNDDNINGGRLKIDEQEDEEEEEEKEEEKEKEKEKKQSPTKRTSNKTNTTKQENKQQQQQQQKSKRRKDRGLDGGYWSRLSVDNNSPDDSGRKRRRTTVDRFELSNYSSLSHSRLNTSAEDSTTEDTKSLQEENKKFVLFRSKSFLAVRNETGSFYLCQAVNSIYEDSKKCKIQWLEEIEEGKNKYKYGLVDWVDPFTIISKVSVNRISADSNLFEIDQADLKKVHELLEKALKDGGITVYFMPGMDSESDEEEEEEEKKTKNGDNDDDSDDEEEIKPKPINLNNEEFYDKEEDSSSIELSTKQLKNKSKKIESDEEESNTKPKQEQKPVKKEISSLTKTINNKSSIQIKKLKPPSASATTPQQDKSIVHKAKLKLKNNKNSDTDELESDKETKIVKKQRLNESPQTQAQAQTQQTQVQKSSPELLKEKKRRLIKIISNRLLEENQKVEVIQNDLFFEDKSLIPFVSPLVQSKLAFRAVYLGDLKLIKSLIEDTQKVPSVHVQRSVHNKLTPAQYSILLENQSTLEIFIDDYLKPRPKRAKNLDALFDKLTGQSYNIYLKKLTESRGQREGNQAFNKDSNAFRHKSKNEFFSDLFQFCFEYGSSIELFNFLLFKFKSQLDQSNLSNNNFISYDTKFIYENIYKAVLFGNRKLAAHVLETAPSGHGFNQVHIEVLKADNDAELKCQLRANQCTKKPFSNDSITPIHCACINPNVKYLKTLLSITQDFNITDKKGRKPIHFAAVCQGPTPLEYLISRVSPYELDSDGNTPLHYACLAGRSVNVEILLNFALKKQEDDKMLTNELIIDNKYGLGGVNKPNRKGQLPIHLAISRNNYDCVKVLLKYSCNIEYPLPNSMDKITPLMYAAQLGHFKIVKLLIENNAKIEARDRYQRNALIHSAINGNLTVLSYLLRLGSNPNSVDSSNNTCLHYACAYGWYFLVKCLKQAGAKINLTNDWKLNAFGAAFLKGHVGICDLLLELYPNEIDVNFRTEDGETLVMLSVSLNGLLNEMNVNQLDYIINKLNGNVRLRDSRGNNAFHYLASNRVDSNLIEKQFESNLDLVQEKCIEQENFRIKMAELLFKSNCNPNLENNELETPFITALLNLNFKFARYMLKNQNFNIKITSKTTASNQTVLSIMASKCTDMDSSYVLLGPEYKDLELFSKFKNEFEQMAIKKDDQNLTPVQACLVKVSSYLNQNEENKITDSLEKFLIFLYKHCKSDLNELVYDKTDLDDNLIEESDCEPKTAKFRPGLFYLISSKSIKLIDELNLIKKIDLSTKDNDGLSILLKSIQSKQTLFSLKLIEFINLDHLDQHIADKGSFLQENLIQFCIRHSEFQVLDKILDLFKQNLKEKEKIRKFLLHKNTLDQTMLHLLAENVSSSVDKKFLDNLYDCLAIIFDNDLSVLYEMLTSLDSNLRSPIHLCLLNSNERCLNQANLDLELFFLNTVFKNADLMLKHKIMSLRDSKSRLALHYLFVNNSKFESDLLNVENLSQIDPVELLTLVIEKTPRESLDSKDINGYTPLHFAAMRGSTISCSILISHGCSLVQKTLDLNTPTSLAIYFKRDTCLLQFLRSDSLNLNDYFYLVKKDNTSLKINLYKLILDLKWEGINWLILSELKKYNLTKFDAISNGLLSNNLGLVYRLIERFEKEMFETEFDDLVLSKSTHESKTLLHFISDLSWSDKNSSLLKLILDKILPKKNLNTQKINEFIQSRDSYGSTFLHYACVGLKFDLIDYIFDYVSSNQCLIQPDKLLFSLNDKHEQTCFSLLFWNIGKLQYTSVHKEKIKSYTKAYLSETYSRDLVSKAYYPGLNESLFSRQETLSYDYPLVDPGDLNNGQINALLFAIKQQSFDMCKFLLKELEFDVNSVDSNQVCALVYAIRVNNPNLCYLLFDFDYEIYKPVANKNNLVEQNQKFSRVKNLFQTMNNNKTLDDDENMSDDLSEDLEQLPEANDDHIIEYNIDNETNNVEITLKSNLKLNILDSKLRTVFHHLASPIEFGSYQNLDLCRYLFKAFNSSKINLCDFLKRVDTNIKTALDYALKNGNLDLFEEFKKVLNRSDLAKLTRFDINDNLYESKVPNFESDSSLFLKNFIESNSKPILDPKSEYFKVDPMSNMNKIGSLIWDDKTRIPYDVIMTKTDVSYGLYGMHSFYKMQLISNQFETKFNENKSCVLFTRWGRIGEMGQCQRTPFSNFKTAREEFLKIFKQKTGNDFVETCLEKTKKFESKLRKYNLVKFESRLRPKLDDIKFDLFDFDKTKIDIEFKKSKFTPDINFKEFFIDLLNVNYLKMKINKNSQLSIDYLPLTQLTQENLDKARHILFKNLKPLIEKRIEFEKLSKKEHVSDYAALLDQINKYSNEYYELIPQMNYNYEKLKPISNERELDYQTFVLNQLGHSQLSCRILMGAKYSMQSPTGLSPFDYVYKCLNCRLELLNESLIEYKYILKYISNSNQNKFKIKRVFKFNRSDQEDKFDNFSLPSGCNKYKNRILLWHGTSTENLISIMVRGLVKAPCDSKSNGQRYGKGIYFSDSFEFSSAYSSGRIVNKQGKRISRNYMLLCEVNLGKVKELRTSYESLDSLPSEFDSVKALGRLEPDPKYRVVLPNGSVIPLGKMIQSEFKPGEYYYSRSANENQYVVYNENQCCIRYIIQFELDN